MSAMNQLFYPTIDLFIYDLRSPLNTDSAEISDNLQSFQQRLPHNNQFHDIETETEYLELTTPPILKRAAVNPSLGEVNFYSVRLNDTYGLQVDCSVNNLTEPQSTDSFRQIQTEIQPDSNLTSLSIGQTWLISGWLTEDTLDPESIAKECYQILFPENQWVKDLYGKDDFLQGTIWELWQSRSYPNAHIIIILFKDRATAEKAGSFYTDWMGLFCYRHKITWAYKNSRLIKESLVNHYKKVENNAKIIEKSQNLKIDLKNLQQNFNEIQTVLNQYTANLLELAFQKETIEINLVNYQTRLEFIKRKAGDETNLTFFDKFSDLTEKKYLPQIVRDNNNMQLGLQLLESNINALRSQIELEKSERDRNFQNMITLVGSGTAIAAYIDLEGNKCQAIIKSFKKTESKINSKNTSQTTPDFCNNLLISGFLFPISFLIILGLIGLALKRIIQKFN
ncbi:MAG: hypothetical protein ACKN9E_05915 [Microcystaceae cyanobacterium]